MQVIYKISGTPEPIIKNTRTYRKVLDSYNSRKLDYQMQLTNQHVGKMLTGAWALQAQFLFYCSSSQHRAHTQVPSITQLMRFVDDVARGIIYDNECIITDVNASKDYTHDQTETILIFTRK